eukprot:11206905-Lingulodinium_polyedra.AAC.1
MAELPTHTVNAGANDYFAKMVLPKTTNPAKTSSGKEVIKQQYGFTMNNGMSRKKMVLAFDVDK